MIAGGTSRNFSAMQSSAAIGVDIDQAALMKLGMSTHPRANRSALLGARTAGVELQSPFNLAEAAG
jgi:hypothetical protein